ncbi:MAG TPA: hypothetical protein VN238_11290 [Solirubrobacteraceae bacterium]|nr:hypothetical protein [Solirubrobacteraceae bacterium]
MTTKGEFTAAEWERLGRAPLVAGLAVSFADPSGPLDTVKESAAALRTLAEAAQPNADTDHGPFVRALAQDVVGKGQNPLGDFRPSRRGGLDECLDELRHAARLLDRVTTEEHAAYIAWVRTAAQRVALAAREGGFLGIGGQQVSEREQEMLEKLGQIFGVRPGGAAAPQPVPTPVPEDAIAPDTAPEAPAPGDPAR